MALRYKYTPPDEADLDITSFMSLMIVLVPVLLLTITFVQTSVHEVELPDLTGGSVVSDESQARLEVVVDGEGFAIYYPDRRSLIKQLPLLETDTGSAYDFMGLSAVLHNVKSQVHERRDILLLAAPDLDYQSLVSTMDAVKTYRTVVAASVVEVELFPEIQLAQAG